MRKHAIVSAAWLAIIAILLLAFSASYLPTPFIFPIVFAILAWQMFFLGPVALRRLTNPGGNLVFKYLVRAFVVLLFLGYLLLFYGLAEFAFSYYLSDDE